MEEIDSFIFFFKENMCATKNQVFSVLSPSVCTGQNLAERSIMAPFVIKSAVSRAKFTFLGKVHAIQTLM